MPLLELRDISRFFGGVHALEQVSMHVQAGTVHGLIGPNGAGKTTLINLLTGFYRPTRGQILLGGQRLEGLRPHRIARLGVARTFQNIRLFGNLTALDNVLIGRDAVGCADHSDASSSSPVRRVRTAPIPAGAGSTGRLGVNGHDRRPAGALSYGDQRRVELVVPWQPSRACCCWTSRRGMNREETDRLGRVIRTLITPPGNPVDRA